MAEASSTDARLVAGFIELCDPEGLQQFAPVNFDWNQPIGDTSRLPLVMAIKQSLTSTAAKRQKQLALIEWLLRVGADPLRKMPEHSIGFCIYLPDRDETSVDTACAGESTMSFIFSLLGSLRQGAGDADWSSECKHLEDVLAVIKRATSAKTAAGHKVAVHQDVVSLWESLRDFTSTHNVIFEAADGEVSAHDMVLMLASPVFW